VVSEYESRLGSGEIFKLSTIFSHFELSLRKLDRGPLRSYVVLLTSGRPLTQSCLLFQRLQTIGISDTFVTAILRLYEIVIGRFQIVNGFFDMVSGTIGVKQGCPLSPTLFGLYIDDLEDFLRLHTNIDDSCLFYHIQIAILLFADDVILLSHSQEGLQ